MQSISSPRPNLETIIQNITLCFFKLSIYAGLVIYSIIDGIIDEFTDASGIDAGTSTNEIYNAGGNYYSPSLTPVISQLNGATAWGVGNVGGNQTALAQSFTLGALTSITAVRVNFGANSGAPAGNLTLRIETDNAGAPSGILANANLTIALIPAASAWNTFTFAVPATLAAATVFWVVLSSGAQGNNIYWQPLSVTPSAYAGGFLSFSTAGVWAAQVIYDMAFEIYSVYDTMDLISIANVAIAQPATARIVLLEIDDAVPIMNVDLLAYASRNNGATWTNLPLVDEGYWAAGSRVISSGAVSIAAQPAGVNMRYRVRTVTKNFRIKGVSLQWA